MGLGICLGWLLGYTTFDDMGIALSVGISIGTIIGRILDYRKSKR